MEINLHNVFKIEVRPRKDIVDFHVRDIVFHFSDYCKKTNTDIDNQFTVSAFTHDKNVASKLSYSKK